MDAGVLIRQARQAARLSQTEVARRAGVAQPVISAYESGRRQPSLRTLEKLIEAAGHVLVLEVRPTPSLQRGLPDSPAGRQLRRHRRAIIDTLASRGARNPRVFGSVARGDDSEGSDVDLLVELDSDVGLVSLAGMTRELADLLGRPVDVVPIDSLKQGVREHALAEAIAL